MTVSSRTGVAGARGASRAVEYLLGAGIVAAVTVAAEMVFDPAQLTDVAMLYLLAVVLASLRLESSASVATTLLAVAVFDFAFIPPRLGLIMGEVRHLVTFAVMLLVALLVNGLARRARHQALAASARERRTAALCAMSRDLGSAAERQALVSAAARHIAAEFAAEVVVFAPEPGAAGAPSPERQGERVLAVVHRTPDAPRGAVEDSAGAWAFRHGDDAGLGARAFPQARGRYLPLVGPHGRLGVVGLSPRERHLLDDPEQRRALDDFVVHLGVALERTQMAAEAERARLTAESERLRNVLLSSVSHDLRTPLGAIEGAASALLSLGGSLGEPTRRELVETIHEEAQRLGRHLANLLDITRLEAGAIRLRRELQPLEEVVGSALQQLEQRLIGREVTTDLPPTLPPVRIDAVLVGQVLVNLLENAVKYSPPGSPLCVAAEPASEGDVQVSVADRGPGIRAGHETRIFEKFERSSTDGSAGGVGLGLAICRAIVIAHGGRIWVEERPGGGALFKLTLPSGDGPAEARRAAPPPAGGLEAVS